MEYQVSRWIQRANSFYRVLLDNLLLPYTIDLSIFHQIDNPAMVEQSQRVGVNFYNK